MNENYLNRSYERHKNDSDESLKKIVSNPNNYSQEVVHAAKTILQERTTDDEHTNKQLSLDNANLLENPVVVLESINRNINAIKNIIIVLMIISIINAMVQFVL